MKPRYLTVLGSTGSVGRSVLDICRQHPQQFKIFALVAGQNVDLIWSQILEFEPSYVVMASKEALGLLQDRILQRKLKTKVFQGALAMADVCTAREVDVVVSAIVGASGLLPTQSAIQAGKVVALANKESLVIAGELLATQARKTGATIVPVDSEHSAIFQCLKGEHPDDVVRLMLTASGGPFFGKSVSALSRVTREQALKHPNWSMGQKITIDSATMMNKGLEVMEARWLFDIALNRIDVVVHPQSIIHSMVEFVDGSVMAHLGEPDMRVPVAYALSYPRRMKTGTKRLNLIEREKLTFFAPDLETFRCLKLAFQVAEQGQTYPAVLNGANEIAVERFLNNEIKFIQIPEVVEECLQRHKPQALESLQNVHDADEWARAIARKVI